jgi:hypothetical protein
MPETLSCSRCGAAVVVGNLAMHWPHELFAFLDAQPVPTAHGFARIPGSCALLAPRFVRTALSPAYVPHACR